MRVSQRQLPRLQANAHFQTRGGCGIPIYRAFLGNYPIFLGSRLPLSDSASCTCRTRQQGGWLMEGPRSWLAACQAALASAAGWAGFPFLPHAAARPFGTLLGRVPARTRTRPQLASGFPGRCAVLRDKGVSRLLSALPQPAPTPHLGRRRRCATPPAYPARRRARLPPHRSCPFIRGGAAGLALQITDIWKSRCQPPLGARVQIVRPWLLLPAGRPRPCTGSLEVGISARTRARSSLERALPSADGHPPPSPSTGLRCPRPATRVDVAHRSYSHPRLRSAARLQSAAALPIPQGPPAPLRRPWPRAPAHVCPRSGNGTLCWPCCCIHSQMAARARGHFTEGAPTRVVIVTHTGPCTIQIRAVLRCESEMGGDG